MRVLRESHNWRGLTLRCTRSATAGFASLRPRVNSNVSPHMCITMYCYRVRLICIASLSLAASLAAVAQSDPPQYGIKFDSPPTGSHIRRDAVRGKAVPLNRTYPQLTAEQRALVHSWYESIAPGDEPPFPAEGTKPIHDALRKAQAKLLVSGELMLIATVEPNGEVSSVKAIGSPSPEMTKVAGTVVLLTKFKPAVCSGQPCKMEFPLWYEFRVVQ
jgi:hypothetical protein